MATVMAATAASSPPITQLVKEVHGPKLLVVESDRLVREACRDAASSLGYEVHATDSIEQALWFLGPRSIDIVLLDWDLPSGPAPDVLQQLKGKRPECEIVALVNNVQIRSAVEAMRAGAFDCLPKPFGLRELKVVLERVSEQLRRKAEKQTLTKQSRFAKGFAGILGGSPEMERLYRMIGKASQSSHPVLILGESGTGKELVAKSIHFSGPLRDKPFIPVDCGSLIPTLIESELFGHVKGAFTGAIQAKPGLLAIADGGTVFLDEIGELPIDLQSKLLRALQEREIRPVGGTKTIPIDVRVLAATNKHLEDAVSRGEFRQDLYFRLNVLNLRVPPLRERSEDIPLLIGSFLERLSHESGRRYQVSQDAMKALAAYDWPGNVRELENCIERACAMNSGPVIHVNDLSEVVARLGKTCANEKPDGVLPMAELERQAILGAIEHLHGDKLTAAKLLGIGKTTLYRKLKEYGAA